MTRKERRGCGRWIEYQRATSTATPLSCKASTGAAAAPLLPHLLFPIQNPGGSVLAQTGSCHGMGTGCGPFSRASVINIHDTGLLAGVHGLLVKHLVVFHQSQKG